MEELKKNAGFTKELIKNNIGLGGRPYKLNFAVTYRCNARCETCNIWKKDADPDIGTEKIRRFVSENPFLRWVSLTGGEPFLREDLTEIVEILNEETELTILNIPTNGIKTSKIVEKVRDILKNDIPHVIVTVSLNGPKEIHEKINGVEGSWERSLETFEELKKIEEASKGFRTYLEYNVSGRNQDMFEETLESVSKVTEVDREDFVVTFYHTSDHYYGNNEDSNPEFEGLEEFVNSNSSFPLGPADLVNQIFLKLSPDQLEENRFPCEALSSSVFVDPSGNIYPCVVHSESIGSLEEHDFSLEKALGEVDRESTIEGCGGCWLPCESNQRIMSNMPRALKEYFKNFL